MLSLRAQPPCYGKDKIAVELRKRGLAISVSMVGRILSGAKSRGLLREPPRPGVRCRNPRAKRPYAVRKPKDYRPPAQSTSSKWTPLTSAALSSVILKHFTARYAPNEYT